MANAHGTTITDLALTKNLISFYNIFTAQRPFKYSCKSFTSIHCAFISWFIHTKDTFSKDQNVILTLIKCFCCVITNPTQIQIQLTHKYK